MMTVAAVATSTIGTAALTRRACASFRESCGYAGQFGFFFFCGSAIGDQPFCRGISIHCVGVCRTIAPVLE